LKVDKPVHDTIQNVVISCLTRLSHILENIAHGLSATEGIKMFMRDIARLSLEILKLEIILQAKQLSDIGLYYKEQPSEFILSALPIPFIEKRLKTKDVSKFEVIFMGLKILQEKDYRNILLNTEPSQQPLEEFVKSASKQKEITRLIQQAVSAYEDLPGVLSSEDFRKLLMEELEVLYRWIPGPLFKRFYNDDPGLPAHALPHALDVLMRCLQIIQRDPDISINDIDIESLIFAALGHDLSCIMCRLSHHKNSAKWLGAILSKEGKLSAEKIENIVRIARGHEKIEDKPREEHQMPEARLVHDADILATVFHPERIYESWLGWSVEESFYPSHWPLSDSKFYNPAQKFEERLEAIKQKKYNYGQSDGVNDLFVKVLYRRLKMDAYLTQGARRIVAMADKSHAVLTDYIEQNREAIKRHYGLEDQQVNEIIDILIRLHDYFFSESPLGAARIP